MADFLSNLRMNNIYGKPGELGPPNMNPGINLDEISNVLNRVHDYQYSRGKDELNNQLELMKASKNPNFGADPNAVARANGLNQNIGTNRVGAIAGGGNAPQQMNTVLADPLNKQVLEQQKLAEQKNEFGQTLGEKRNEFGGKQDINQQKVDISGQRADTSDWRAQIADFKSKNPGSKILAPKGGNFQLINPVTHEVSDTGVKTGNMTDEDRINLNNDNAMGQINARGDNSLANIAARGNENRQTQGEKGVQGVKSSSAINTTRDQVNKARELANTRPDLKQYIKFDPNSPNQFTIDENTPPEEMNQIRNTIYGKATDINLPKDKSSNTKKPDPLGIRPDEDEEE